MLFSKNILLLLFLYFIQGLPYGFQASFLPTFLRQQGISLTTVGLFKLLLAPWLCKALWAPLVDRYATKHRWLLWSIGGLLFTCFCGCFINPHQTGLLSVVLFLLNVFAATQDIAVDAIAVAILDPQELGKGNTAQVVGYKIGSIFGGGVLVWFIDLLGWSGLFAALTILYVEAWMFVYVSPSLREFDLRMQRQAADVITDYANMGDFNWQDDSSVFTNDSSSSSLFPEQSLRRKPRCEDLKDINPDGFRVEDPISSDEEIPLSASHLHAQRVRKAKLKARQAKEAAARDNEINNAKCDSINISNESQQASLNVTLQGKDLADSSSQQMSDKVRLDWSEEITHLVDEEIVDVVKEEIEATSDNHTESNSNDLFSNLRRRHVTQSPQSLHIEQSAVNANTVVESAKVSKDGAQAQGDSVRTASPVVSKDSQDSPQLGRSQLNSEEYVADAEDSDSSSKEERVEEEDLEESEEKGSSVITHDDEEEELEGLAFLRKLVRVPGTMWMITLVLAYKLGEQGCIGMLPQFLVDQHVKLSDVTFWKGLMGQGVGIIGSLIGGWVVSHQNIPLYLLLQQLCLLRLLPVGGLLAVVSCWSWHLVPTHVLYLVAIPLLCLLLTLGGAVTTVTFTFMMQCSKMAPSGVQATHYTTLATLEVFGKLGFMSLAGFLTDILGYPAMFVAFTILSAAILPWFDRCPDDLKLIAEKLQEQADGIQEGDEEDEVLMGGVKEKVS